jgi:Tol biopolymer transport system component
MPLEAGQQLLHYRLIAKIGEGGMGVVWRARDPRLDRDVAIKVLPEAFVSDPERLARFEREAKVLASLNHTNVGQIYGVEETEGRKALILELVEGPTLADRIARGPLPLREALETARQIAEGLEAAHELGVTHRDLKPANVKVRADGAVKLLDFGLAKASGSDGTSGPSESDTRTIGSTRTGTVLGTAAYMSPEQACGRPVDKRTDVWAFGCLLFECLSGRPLFRRDSVAETLAAIVEREPEWDRLPADTPATIRRLLRRCLRKDSRLRTRDVGDARIEIVDVLDGGTDSAGDEPVRKVATGGRAWIAATVLAAFAIGVAAGWSWIASSSPQTLPHFRSLRLTEMAGIEETPAVSPDGKAVAFVAPVDDTRQVFVRLLDKGAPIQVTDEPADHSFPRWADESTLIYYRHPVNEVDAGALWQTLVPSSTPPRRIGPAQGGADVSHSGRWIATFRTDDEGPALVLIDRDGVEPEVVKRLPPAVYSTPRWSPDDGSIAFQAARVEFFDNEIRSIRRDAEEARVVARAGQIRGLAWLPDGSGLVYATSEGAALAYPPIFTLKVVDPTGEPLLDVPLADAGYASYVEPDVTRDGKLVVSRVRMESDVFRFPVDGSPVQNVANAERVTTQTGQVQTPSASPSGDEVAYLSDSGGHANVWIARVDGSRPPLQITNESDPSTAVGIPLWSPAGDSIIFVKHPAGVGLEEWLIRPDGTGERLLAEGAGASWSHDGEWVYYVTRSTVSSAEPCTRKVRVDGTESVPVRCGALGLAVSSDGATGYFSPAADRVGEVWKVTPVDTGDPEPLVTNLESRIPMRPHHYQLSPDDRWLATPLEDRGTTNLWLVSTEDGSLRRVTDFGRRPTMIGRQVSWSGDGRHLFAAVAEMDADIVLLEGVLP